MPFFPLKKEQTESKTPTSLSTAGQQQRRQYKPRFLGSHQHSITRHLTHLVLGTILPISGCAVSSLYFYKDMKAAAKLRVHLPPSHPFPYPLAMLSSLSLTLSQMKAPVSSHCHDQGMSLPLNTLKPFRNGGCCILIKPASTMVLSRNFEFTVYGVSGVRERGGIHRGSVPIKKGLKNGLSASKALQRTAGKALFLLILRSIKIHVSVLPL